MFSPTRKGFPNCRRCFGICQVLITGDMVCKLSRTLSTMKSLGNPKIILYVFSMQIYMWENAEINAWRFEHQEDNRGSLWRDMMRNGWEVGIKGNLNHSSKFWIFLQKECTPVLPILFNSNTNILNDFLHKNQVLDFLVVYWLRICLPMREREFKAWSRKIPLAMGHLSLCATITEPEFCNYWILHALGPVNHN